jgi:hypothetical protein
MRRRGRRGAPPAPHRRPPAPPSSPRPATPASARAWSVRRFEAHIDAYPSTTPACFPKTRSRSAHPTREPRPWAGPGLRDRAWVAPAPGRNPCPSPALRHPRTRLTRPSHSPRHRRLRRGPLPCGGTGSTVVASRQGNLENSLGPSPIADGADRSRADDSFIWQSSRQDRPVRRSCCSSAAGTWSKAARARSRTEAAFEGAGALQRSSGMNSAASLS